ncbi:hypothetical protein C8Q70DRAFT_1059495 [Cubamyces menziesii]|uniref:Uncharacterized protein n=1 Tax=Trametes cubensis TaxID=1111947 RepID=A0AAD7TH69_9APHY|nr:hypothetical protein C8Q70DRAFT_1059495 [Cubamyces menziesii]KAJ8457296.1 hypothetical protein ONZ51_g11622 [Trametes cubensis]
MLVFIKFSVEKVIKMRGLEAYADTIINSVEVKHRKRTTIAVELVTKPSLVFFDELTSGPALPAHSVIVVACTPLVLHGAPVASLSARCMIFARAWTCAALVSTRKSIGLAAFPCAPRRARSFRPISPLTLTALHLPTGFSIIALDIALALPHAQLDPSSLLCRNASPFPLQTFPFAHTLAASRHGPDLPGPPAARAGVLNEQTTLYGLLTLSPSHHLDDLPGPTVTYSCQAECLYDTSVVVNTVTYKTIAMFRTF